ncbi:uncharacterized protein LOC130184542 [Seriola aureovittata]|uniref:uncharacterized protein LOC130184542 n=1 Tax=Seriola aureovittata TaxID=2871759 RepID=UPI0024BE2497|nr:uncharacterized protein LOC130184542 [Seriola aureovittata]
MDVADKLVDKIFSWVELQKKGSHKLKKLATELEENKKNVNVSKVVGSSVSVGGAAAVTAAGVLTFFTAGLAAPLLVVGAVASGAGLVTNVGADIVDLIASSRTMKEAEKISEEIQNVEKKLQELMKTLLKEQRDGDNLPPDEYVTERILRAMANNNGLQLHDDVSLYKIITTVTGLSRYRLTGEDGGLSLITRFVVTQVVTQTGKAVASVAASIGGKTAAKAAGRIAGGAVGLAISIPELVINCKNLDNCETEASQRLRENAEAIQKASEELETQLNEIQKVIKRLARVKLCIENEDRSSDQRKELIEFAIENCRDEAVRQWLRENSKSKTFFHLVDVFHLVKKHIDKKEKKKKVDITFVAHGSIRDDDIPASCLLPLPTITDVLLYSPWNCAITAKVAYGIATGLVQTQHRVFICVKKHNCQIPHEGHFPTKLPSRWNSMKRVGVQKIPKIMVSTLRLPKDGAWDCFKSLTATHGKPERSRIVIPFIFPGGPIRIPFFVVTLALSLVLFFYRYEATVHLAACLDDRSDEKFDREFLEKQYSYTIDSTAMTSSADMLPNRHADLYRAFEAVFD